MSGGLPIGIVDFSAFSSSSDRVCCVSFTSFLVRNWSGVQTNPTDFEPRLGELQVGDFGSRHPFEGVRLIAPPGPLIETDD